MQSGSLNFSVPGYYPSFVVVESKETHPKVSIVIPCFNQGKFLGEALRSVQTQTWADWECLVINDGSTDDTSAIVKEIAGMDSRFRLLEQENRGLPSSRNRGLEESRGCFIQFLDADDVLMQDKLEVQLASISGSDPALAYCHYYYGSQEDVWTRYPGARVLPSRLNEKAPIEDVILLWESDLSIPIHCFLFDARLFQSIRFDESLPNHEDWDCLLNILSINPTLHYSEKEMVVYRVNRNSMCRNPGRMRKGFLAAIQKQKRKNKSNAVLYRHFCQKQKKVQESYRIHSLRHRLGQSVKAAGRRILGPMKKFFSPKLSS